MLIILNDSFAQVSFPAFRKSIWKAIITTYSVVKINDEWLVERVG